MTSRNLLLNWNIPFVCERQKTSRTEPLDRALQQALSGYQPELWIRKLVAPQLICDNSVRRTTTTDYRQKNHYDFHPPPTNWKTIHRIFDSKRISINNITFANISIMNRTVRQIPVFGHHSNILSESRQISVEVRLQIENWGCFASRLRVKYMF